MVERQPGIRVTVRNTAQVGDVSPDRIWATCIETNKGPLMDPKLITSAEEAKDIFNFDASGFFNSGGQGLKLIRVGSGDVEKASCIIQDTEENDLLKLTAKSGGTFEILVNTMPYYGSGYTCNISASGYTTEYNEGINTIINLVKLINNKSKLVNAEFIAEPGDGETIETNLNKPLEGGSNGTGDPITGKLPEADAPFAHREGLKLIEHERINGVFSMSEYITVQNEYVYHANTMSQPDICKWRYSLIGAVNRSAKDAIIQRAETYNDERTLYVGRGLITDDGVEYLPYQATIFVAGKRSSLFYGESMFGWEDKKIINGVSNLLDMTTDGIITTDSDMDEYNEKGVITFKKEYDNIAITEGVTTVQADNQTQEDEESVVSIVTYVSYEVYEIARQFIGRNITSELQTAIEEKIKTRLGQIKSEDKTLIDIESPPTSAYDVQVSIQPREDQRTGKISITLTIVPVHALRQIEATIVVL